MRDVLRFISADDEVAMAAVSRCALFRAGDVVLAEGRRSEGLLLIRRGRVRCTSRWSGTVAYFGPGEVLGEESLTGRAMGVTCVAEDPVGVEVIPRRALTRLIVGRPAFGTRLLRSLTVALAGRVESAAGLAVNAP